MQLMLAVFLECVTAYLLSTPDLIGVVLFADQLYTPTADGGRAISDALRETDFLLETAYAIHGENYVHPKNGARFHFQSPDQCRDFVRRTID